MTHPSSLEGNLPYGAKEDDIKRFFKGCGRAISGRMGSAQLHLARHWLVPTSLPSPPRLYLTGEPKEIRILTKKGSGDPKGCAFVDWETSEQQMVRWQAPGGTGALPNPRPLGCSRHPLFSP